MKQQQQASHFRDNHAEVRAEAQRMADSDGHDRGVERDYFGYHHFMLPARQYRFGHERRCEVVMCTDITRCQPGHGPHVGGKDAR